MRAVSVAQMQEMDRRAIEDYGIPGLLLMENAGAAAARAIVARAVPEQTPSQLEAGVLVLAGRGNNGGDGYVVARHLHNAGIAVTIADCGTPRTEDARCNAAIVDALGIERIPLDRQDAWPAAGVVVDALLGVGFRGELREPIAAAVLGANRRRERGALTVALDVPSGLDADSGARPSSAVQADLTITFGIAKRGLLAEEARPFVGRLEVVDISLPRALYDELGQETHE